MLDECSQGTFIDENLLPDAKRKTTITVSTINGEAVSKAYAIDGFVVKYSNKHAELYSQMRLNYLVITIPMIEYEFK